MTPFDAEIPFDDSQVSFDGGQGLPPTMAKFEAVQATQPWAARGQPVTGQGEEE